MHYISGKMTMATRPTSSASNKLAVFVFLGYCKTRNSVFPLAQFDDTSIRKGNTLNSICSLPLCAYDDETRSLAEIRL